MADSTILITGATGFVGSHVAQRLAGEGARVRAFVRRTSDARRLKTLGAEIAQGALDEPATLVPAIAGADVVVHLAALTHARSPREYDRVNDAGTLGLVRAAVEAGSRPRRLVYLSSLAAVGPSRGGRPVRPADEPRPLTAYGRSKLAGERAVAGAGEQLETVILRAPAVYGPGDRELRRFFRLAALGILPVPAGPARMLQLVYVEDLADAIVRAVRGPATGLFHIAEPKAYSWEEVTGLVAEAVGSRARIVRVPDFVLAMAGALSEGASRLAGRSSVFDREKVRELLAPGWLCETDTARRELGFEARTPLARGLAMTADWYRKNGWL